MSTTTIRIGKDDKKQLELLADVEGISVRKALSKAIGFYELALMKKWLKQGNFEWTPELVQAFKEAEAWLKRIGNRKYKELLAKKKGETS